MNEAANLPNPCDDVRVVILVPIFNDWESLTRLLREMDAALQSASIVCRVTVVDDGSTATPSNELLNQKYAHLQKVERIRLRCNLGHQRAIAVGLAHLCKTRDAGSVVVIMDGDGEDRPEHIPRLITALAEQHCGVVFAARTKRMEGLFFRLMYFLYRLAHWLLTGVPVRVGNFSALSFSLLPQLLMRHDLWNHYAATILRSGIRFSTVPIPREQRYAGKSHMRFSNLVAHGLSAIAVFGEVVGARLIIFFSGVTLIAFSLLGMLLGIRLLTAHAIPGWTLIAVCLLLLFGMQALLSILVLALIVLGDRSQARVIPLRDAEWFIESEKSMSSHD
jgi:glycosyltransferase involved in cell wall biosynthesis